MTKPTVVILGPTASGKSDVAMHVAQQSGLTEIIAVDAMMVYRGMDIGTGKPTRHDQTLVPHHCLDIVDPSERFTVAEFQVLANKAISDIYSRDAQPLLVAGTGLYLQAVIDGFTLPGEYPEIRTALESRDLEDLFDELKQLDPNAASKIEPGNRRRIVRALEVCLGSGHKFSSFGPGASAYPNTDVRQIGLRWSREALAIRIETRVRGMIEAGWLAEVEMLIAGDKPLSKTAVQALGYKELISHINGEISLDEAVAQTILRTRQFAVRQERWFRRDPRIEWVDISCDPISGNWVEIVSPMVLKYVGARS